MPRTLIECVRKVKKTVKPKRGQSRKSAAYGICMASTKQKPHKR